MTQEEHLREFRVVDQMISMHSLLSQRKSKHAFLLSMALVFSSAIMCAFTFVDDPTLALLGFSVAKVRLVMGLASAASFGFSIIELKVDWSEKAKAHRDAARRLSTLKAAYRRANATMDTTDRTALWPKLSQEYSSTLDSVEPIPEKDFVPLKAMHLYKRRLSKMVDAHPGCPHWLARLRVRAEATRNLISGKVTIEDAKTK